MYTSWRKHRAVLLLASMLVYSSAVSFGATLFSQVNLTSDVPGLAAVTDPNLKNPWGVSFSPTSPFWVSNQVTNTSTLYNASGAPQGGPLIVSTPGGRTGQVFNSTLLSGTPVFMMGGPTPHKR